MPLPMRARRALWRLSVATNDARRFFESFPAPESLLAADDALHVTHTARAVADGRYDWSRADWIDFYERHVLQLLADLTEAIDERAPDSEWGTVQAEVVGRAMRIKKDIQSAVALFESVDLDAVEDLGRLWSF